MLVKTLILLGLAGLAFAQSDSNRLSPRPLQPVGKITDTSFPGNLAATINGSLPFRPIRFPRLIFVSPFSAVPPYYSPDIQYPLPTVAVQQVNAPAVVIQQLPVFSDAAQDDSPVKVYENPVHKDVQPVELSETAKPEVSDEQPLYLLALKDGTVVSAIAYWTDGSEIKYVTPDRKQKQLPIAKVDVSISNRLNKKTGFPINLNVE